MYTISPYYTAYMFTFIKKKNLENIWPYINYKFSGRKYELVKFACLKKKKSHRPKIDILFGII